jgi:hypothetical protein
VDIDVIDKILTRYSAFFHRMLTGSESSSKSSIYTIQESLGERKTLNFLIILSPSSPYTTRTVRLVAYLRTRNHDVTETIAKADRQGIQSYIRSPFIFYPAELYLHQKCRIMFKMHEEITVR